MTFDQSPTFKVNRGKMAIILAVLRVTSQVGRDTWRGIF